MEQDRYFDYGSKIKSKRSAEAVSLITGIGAKFGFDVVSTNLSKTKLIIGSSVGTDNSDSRYTFSDEKGNLSIPSHLVITPDGILTSIKGDIEIDIPESSQKQYILIATHTYIESSEINNATTFSLIPNNSSGRILVSSTTISDWYEAANSWGSGINLTNTVIIGLINNDDGKYTIYTAYDNIWPEKNSSINLVSDEYTAKTNNTPSNLTVTFSVTTTKINDKSLLNKIKLVAISLTGASSIPNGKLCGYTISANIGDLFNIQRDFQVAVGNHYSMANPKSAILVITQDSVYLYNPDGTPITSIKENDHILFESLL